jgi:hypothetical protein
MHFRENEVRRDEREASDGGLPEEAVGVGVTPVTEADERDPGAAIDE